MALQNEKRIRNEKRLKKKKFKKKTKNGKDAIIKDFKQRKK